MSNYDSVLDLIKGPDKKDEKVIKESKSVVSEAKTVVSVTEFRPFNISKFIEELSNQVDKNRREYVNVNMSAYDISSNCIRQIIYRLLNTPIESYVDKWLPILMRGTIGKAIHEFIQENTGQITEVEVSLKVPSIRFSGRLDGLIGDSILLEIKSLPYKEYGNIIKKKSPRVADFYQAMTYKYILENYLEETKDLRNKIRENTNRPKLNKYNINLIQFIYIANDILSSDTEDLNESIYFISQLKKNLKSKSNTFYFMTTLDIDVSSAAVCKPYFDYIKSKIAAVNYYLDNNLLPPETDPFINKNSCFFCLYQDICDLRT